MAMERATSIMLPDTSTGPGLYDALFASVKPVSEDTPAEASNPPAAQPAAATPEGAADFMAGNSSSIRAAHRRLDAAPVDPSVKSSE